MHRDARENDDQHRGPGDCQHRGKEEDETVELSIEPAACKYLFISKTLI